MSEYEVRLEKLKRLKDSTIDPYPTKAWDDRQDIFAVRSEVADHLIDPEGRDEKERTLAGRIRSIRHQGALIFVDIQDGTGSIQALLKKDILGEKFVQFLDFIDSADYIQVRGPLFVTKSGELTVEVQDWQLLAKAVRPLPEKWHGLADVEKRFRERYLDMIANPQVRERIITRSRIVEIVRQLLISRGFIEVETPSLQPIYGGGFARPFVTHHNKLNADLYLRISSELYLKRLVAGGLERVFEFARIYRNEGIDLTHNPEFTMLEAQAAWVDYTFMMELTEDIFIQVAQEIKGSTDFGYQGQQISLKKPWKRLRVRDGVLAVTGIDFADLKDLRLAKLKALEIGIPEKDVKRINSIGSLLGLVFEEKVEPTLIEPTLVYDYPVETSPLAKRCPHDPRFVERFEPFIGGLEYGNNYTELNDPIDLRQRFVEEKERERVGFEEVHQTDWDYLLMVEHGLPPNTGLGIGIDRLVMLFTNTRSIKEVIAFPTLRSLESASLKSRVQKQASCGKARNNGKKLPNRS